MEVNGSVLRSSIEAYKAHILKAFLLRLINENLQKPLEALLYLYIKTPIEKHKTAPVQVFNR